MGNRIINILKFKIGNMILNFIDNILKYLVVHCKK